MITLYNAQGPDRKLYTFKMKNGKFVEISKQDHPLEGTSTPPGEQIPLEDFHAHHKNDVFSNAEGKLFVPGAIDCHVHSREPGFSYKETWKTLGQSAFKGGVTTIIDMPNTNPATLDRETVLEKIEVAEKSGLNYRFLLGVVDSNLPIINALLDDDSLPLSGVKVYYGKSTGNLLFDNLEALSPIAKKTSKVFVFHCEQQEIIEENMRLYEEEAKKARTPEEFIVHSKIRSSKAAIKATGTVLNWALENNARVHIAHVSTPEELVLVEKAKAKSNQITCEVAPHHLYFCHDDYKKHGGFIKVNPPIRSREEQIALNALVAMGKSNCFSTDHAPHSHIEKDNYYMEVPSGIPALEYFWPLLHNLSHHPESPSKLESLVPMITSEPAEIFGFKNLAGFHSGYSVNMVCLEESPWTLRKEDLEAKCLWSPYVGKTFHSKVKHTWCRGNKVY